MLAQPPHADELVCYVPDGCVIKKGTGIYPVPFSKDDFSLILLVDRRGNLHVAAIRQGSRGYFP